MKYPISTDMIYKISVPYAAACSFIDNNHQHGRLRCFSTWLSPFNGLGTPIPLPTIIIATKKGSQTTSNRLCKTLSIHTGEMTPLSG